MRMNHNYDAYGNTEPSIIYLAKPGKILYCALGGIDTSTVSVALKTNNTAELTFTVNKYIDDEESQGYEELDEMMELYCDGIWYKIVDPPTETNNGMQSTKEIVAESYEISLTQYKLKNCKINMGEEDSYEMMYQASHDTSKFYQIKFYDPENEDLSFLHIVLKHADVPGWKIGYVDNITLDDDGVLLPNEICNFSVDDQNVYAFLTQEAAPAYKCIFEFDTENLLINVYKPDSLGKDTNVVLGFRNIQDSVTISRDDSLVTQFYVEGLDDYNIDLANFGDSVITDLSYFQREPYMNTTLQEKYAAWQKYRESRRYEYCKLSREYNKNLDVLAELTNRVPVDTAQTNWFGQKVDTLKDAYDSNMAIIKGLESIHVDEEGNFDLEDLKNSSDWSLYESIMNYTLPAIVAALQAQDETVEGFGKGNIISCVNPVVLGQDWYMVGSGTSSFKTISIDDAPAYGITRGVQVTGTNGGIYQHNISIEPSQRYTLSCFVKGSGAFYLGYNNTGEDRKNIAYTLSSSWIRVYTSFNLSSHLIDVAFTGDSDFIVCGMQLEMGDAPSQFGYFTQSESIMKAYETDWKLYGIAELKTKIATYDSCIKELKKNGYADGYNALAGYEKAYFTQMHQKYLDYLNLKEQAETALAERQAEYDAAKKPEIQEKRNQIAKDVLIENFGKVQNQYPAFTDKEIYIIKSLYNQATYTNENIIITSLDSTADVVDKAIALYKDAIEELYVESHPQYTYTDEIGNIYALPEFREYHEQLAVNDFVRLGLSDTQYVKLRVVEITYNPCDMDESMEVTFSNMVQYKSKLTNDNEFLTNALNQTSDRNGGRVNSVNKSTTSDYVITSDAIKQIFSNPLFNSMLGGTVTGGAGSGGNITAGTIVAELVKAKEGVFDKLTADTAFIKYLDANLISADTITTRILNAEQANIDKLSAKIIESNEIYSDVANIKNLVAGNAGVGDLHVLRLTAENVEISDAVITNMIAAKITVGDLMAQNALANQIVLISKDNKPTIAFQESTQQFYDADGNIRVQIGMDGNGNFNFVVKNGDKAALFDENGITQTGIPDNTILGDMIDNATITKDKLGFNIIEPNEQGGLDITNIYDGKGNQWWGIEKTSITNDYTNQIKNVTDTLIGEIETKVSNTQYLKDQESIQTAFSEVKQNVSGITSTVSDMKTELGEAQKKITANTSSITQNADKISFMVTGTKESEFEITDKFIQMISDHISIDASTIDINGIITAMNNSIDSSTTRINGGIIDTNTINAMLISAKLLQSLNFKDSIVSDIYAQAGLQINMETGALKAKNFGIDSDGNAYFKGNGEFAGTITANHGKIGGENGFTIEAGKLYSGMDSFNSDASSGVYVGVDGIALGGKKFSVDKSGNVIAASGTFSGTIEADTGKIGGFTISGSSLVGANGGIALNPEYLQYGNNFKVDVNGNLTATNATISGKINATSGTFEDGIFTNVNIESGIIGGFTIDADSLYGNGIKISTNQLKYGDNFYVDSNGYMTANEGIIAGFSIAGSADTSSHMYINTLYAMATDGTYDYQSGMKGANGKKDTTEPTEAAFYIRKKKSSDAWSTSTSELPFYVRKNGQMYCEDLTIGTSLYMYRTNPSSDSLITTKEKVLTFDQSYNDLTLGLYGKTAIYGISFREDRTELSRENSYLWFENNVFYSPNTGMDLGKKDHHFDTLYVDHIVLGKEDSISKWSSSSTTPTGLYENTIRIGSKNEDGTTNGSGAGGGNTYKVYSKEQWTYTDENNNTISVSVLPITCKTIGAALQGHTHSGYVSKTGTSTSSPITGTLHVSNGKGWDMLNTSGNEVTGIYCNTSNQVMIADNTCETILRGNGIQLGNNSTVINIPYLPNYTSTTKYLVADSNGNIGWRTVTQGKTYNLANTNTYGVMCLYSSTGSNTNGTMTQKAITEAINNSDGTTYSAGTGISISGTTISVKSNTYAAYSHSHSEYASLSHTHRGINNSTGYGLWTNGQSGSSACVYGASSSSGSTTNATVNLGFQGGAFNAVHYTTLNKGSDRNIKECIDSYDDNIEKAYMEFKPVSYKYKTTNSIRVHDRIHYGFIAQDVESAIHKYGIDNEHAGFLQISKLNPDNEWGLDKLYSLAYDEFISLNTHMTQKAHHRIDSLEEQNTSLKSENQSLKNEILILQGQLSLITQRLKKMEEKIC